ncbi:UbiA prenyltransferase, partial [Amylostereum chailletii]
MAERFSWHAYLELTRLHKGILGNTLVFWPSAWGLTMAAYTTALPTKTLITRLAAYAVATLIFHSSGCVWNDILDVNLDKKIERTKHRPLPSGRAPLRGAYILYGALVCSLVALLFLTKGYTFIFGVVGISILSPLYPMMKRWTWWPQAWLGLVMNWGLPMAWTSSTGHPPPSFIWVLYIGSGCWTVVYDTIYACQDRKDDAREGIKSTAVLFGRRARLILIGFLSAFFLCLIHAGVENDHGIAFFAVSCGGTFLHSAWQFMFWD